MNKLQTNALRIADLMGYEEIHEIAHTPTYEYNGLKFKEYDIKQIFSSYNGLMPIVFECNSESPYGDIFNISIYYNSVVVYINSGRSSSHYYTTEPEFIEAIQLACIKYLELK